MKVKPLANCNMGEEAIIPLNPLLEENLAERQSMNPDSLSNYPLKRHGNAFNAIYITQCLFNGCFYGFKAIFVLGAIHERGIMEGDAISLFATFMLLCYGTSFIGGYIADQKLGVKNTIMLGGIFSSLGLLCLIVPLHGLSYLGLALASLGSGFFKPNISTSLGLLFEDPKDPGKDKAYSHFYMAMNLGSLVAPIICGFVGQTYGWNYGAALIAAVFLGATIFVHKTMPCHSRLPHIRPVPSYFRLFCGILFLIALLYCVFKYRHYFHGLMGVITCGSILYLGRIYFQCNHQEKKDVVKICLYVLLFALFCALFEQGGTSLMLFYEKALDRQIMGTIIPASVFLSLDPLFILTIGNLFLFVSTRYLEKEKTIVGFIKIGCGFLCASLCFGILALSVHLNLPSLISPLWIVGAGFIQVIGEMLVAPVCLSQISQYAPPRFQSELMSFWLMAIAYGHYFAGFIAQFSLTEAVSQSAGSSYSQYQTFFSSLSLIALSIGVILLLWQSRRKAPGAKHQKRVQRFDITV